MHSFSCSAAWNFLAECLSVGGVYGGWPSKALFFFGKTAKMQGFSLGKTAKTSYFRIGKAAMMPRKVFKQ